VKQVALSAIAIHADASPSTPVTELSDFDTVVRCYWPRIFRFVLASTRDRDAAESLTQDCLLRAYQCRDRFRGEASLNTWLMQIAINLVRDYWRNRRLQFWKRAQSTAIDPSVLSERIAGRETSPEARTVAMDQMEAVWRASANLPERQKTVFLLRFMEEMELLEIAEAMGIREGAVKVHLFRAVHTVRRRIGGKS